MSNPPINLASLSTERSPSPPEEPPRQRRRVVLLSAEEAQARRDLAASFEREFEGEPVVLVEAASSSSRPVPAERHPEPKPEPKPKPRPKRKKKKQNRSPNHSNQQHLNVHPAMLRIPLRRPSTSMPDGTIFTGSTTIWDQEGKAEARIGDNCTSTSTSTSTRTSISFSTHC